MANLKIGSKGDDVKQLQTALNATGDYNLKVDGIFGKDTDKAVRDYQGKNKLSVDGIAGVKTMGALGITAKQPAATSSAVSAKPASVSIEDQARQDYLNLMANKPGEYSRTYGQQLNDTVNSILNREAFNYDFNGDPLYQLYKDQYVQGGQAAMQDTMAQAAALTGGYGNSYASAAGNQAYQQYLKGLNDVIPELQQAAYNRYLNEGQEMADRLNMLMTLDNNEYNRWSDNYNLWNNDVINAYNTYANERSFGYNAENDAYNRKLQEAQLAASVGDLSKLEKLGIDTSKYTAEGSSSGTNADAYKMTTERWNDTFKAWSTTMTKEEMAYEAYKILSGTSGLYNDAEAIFRLAQQYGFLDELSALTHNDTWKAEKGREAEVSAIKNGTRQLSAKEMLMDDFFKNPEKYVNQVGLDAKKKKEEEEKREKKMQIEPNWGRGWSPNT
ncbi:MAG: peptidoglycan-binding protein [Clostridiales bacterium]|nr:peptidoglycan-binding protein [Clostridiales bacterium]